ncbi:MAG TPA: S24 family peptidase [Bryobacteraceae bacterium]|nr:S24 family peptidase [Bryobacteraceae bacterium]
MRAVVTPIGPSSRDQRQGSWSLLEIAPPGTAPVPWGILLRDTGNDKLALRLRGTEGLGDLTDTLEEEDLDILDFLQDDLLSKAEEMGAEALLASFEESLSGFLRISDSTAISWHGDAQRTADLLFDQYVDRQIRPYVTHLPLYGLRAAATKFGEGSEGDIERWVRAPEHLRLTEDLFAARVVGRSMEPLIPDGSLCVFRAGVRGSRQGRRLLIEKFGETDFASRYTVKRYTSTKTSDGETWEHSGIRLEPLNPEFEAFDLGTDEFRVIGEFVEVLGF